MKSPPGSISPPAECRDQLQIGPQSRVFGDDASGSSFWKIMAALSVLGQKGFYRRRRGPGSRGRRGRGRTCGRCSTGARRRAIARAWAPPPPGTPRRSSDPTTTRPPPPPHRRSPAAPAPLPPPSPGFLLPPPQPFLLMYCARAKNWRVAGCSIVPVTGDGEVARATRQGGTADGGGYMVVADWPWSERS